MRASSFTRAILSAMSWASAERFYSSSVRVWASWNSTVVRRSISCCRSCALIDRVFFLLSFSFILLFSSSVIFVSILSIISFYFFASSWSNFCFYSWKWSHFGAVILFFLSLRCFFSDFSSLSIALSINSGLTTSLLAIFNILTKLIYFLCASCYIRAIFLLRALWSAEIFKFIFTRSISCFLR